MINKDKLCKQIHHLIDQEKSLIPLLNRHVSSALFFSNLTDEEREDMIDHFQHIAIKQRDHISILEGIEKEITEGETNVY